MNEDVSEKLLVQGFDIIFKELNRYIKIMNNIFKGIDWSSYVKSRTSDDANKSMYGESQAHIPLLDDDQEEEKIDKDADPEAKQKFRIKRQLEQIDKIYHESYLKRLVKIVEIFTSVQS